MQKFARQAIITKYHGATNVKGARVSASAEGPGRKIYSWDDALDVFGNHQAAAIRFANTFEWINPKDPNSADQLVGGGTIDGYCFVLLDEAPPTSLMGDWRDNVVDMLRTDDFTSAIETIVNEAGVADIEVTKPWGEMGKWTRQGRVFYLDGAVQFYVDKKGNLSPTDADDISKDILKLLRATK